MEHNIVKMVALKSKWITEEGVSSSIQGRGSLMNKHKSLWAGKKKKVGEICFIFRYFNEKEVLKF